MNALFPLLLLLLLPPASLAAVHPLLNAFAPDFTILDQQDQPFHLRDARGNIVVLLAADKEGESQMKPWQVKLTERFPNAVITLGVADVRAVPFFMKRSVKDRFRKDHARILLDWKGEVSKNYFLPEKVATVIVIDKQGMVRSITSGQATGAAVETLFDQIDRLRAE